MDFNEQIDSLVSHLKRLKTNLSVQQKTLDTIIWNCVSRIERESGTRVAITGVGKNASLAMKASESYASLGVPSLYLNTCHLSHGDFGFLGSKDVIIHLSRSGTTEEMLGASIHLDKIKPYTSQVLLTCQEIGHFDDSKNHSHFDHILYTGRAAEIDYNHLAPTTSTTVLLTLLDLIGTNISHKLGFTRDDFLEYHPGGALGAMLRKEVNA